MEGEYNKFLPLKHYVLCFRCCCLFCAHSGFIAAYMTMPFYLCNVILWKFSDENGVSSNILHVHCKSFRQVSVSIVANMRNGSDE